VKDWRKLPKTQNAVNSWPNYEEVPPTTLQMIVRNYALLDEFETKLIFLKGGKEVPVPGAPVHVPSQTSERRLAESARFSDTSVDMVGLPLLLIIMVVGFLIWRRFSRSKPIPRGVRGVLKKPIQRVLDRSALN